MKIFFPGSPGFEVDVSRGGTDPIFGEPQGPQHVNITWTEVEHYDEDEEYIDDEGKVATRTITRTREVTRGTSFKGPPV